jgi:23S rRNA (uracil1939-C5)-methyltransferase
VSGEATTSARRPERGERLRLKVDALAYGGEGIARHGPDGYVVFVAGAVPGDVVEALVYKRKRAYAHARTTEVIEPSPERIEPVADHPGVPWQVLPYERQLEVKATQVDDALRRIGRLDGFSLAPIVPALQQWRYRNKLEYSFGQDAGGQLVCGFHAPAGWNRVIQIEDCLLASELGNRARRAALAWAREQGLTAWERAASPREGDRAARIGPAADGRARLRNLVVREGRRTGKLQLRLVSTPGELDIEGLAQALLAEIGAEALSGLFWTRSESLAESTGGGETELVTGEQQLPERLGDLDLRISPEAFLQTNTEMAEVLYGVVAEEASLRGFERVFDLYCGTGTIALSLAPRAGELWGVDVVPEAIADAIASAERNGIAGARFFAGDTRLALPELVERAGRPEVLVVDPPRAGLSQRVVRRIIDAGPRRIVYVSCNPTTLAPNAAQLGEAGWSLQRVTPVDMFPQTHHVECVARFDREL